LAFDASSAAVRGAVLRGIATLVPNPLAQPLLARLLPQLAPLAFDPALSVRTALADLLLVIKYGKHFAHNPKQFSLRLIPSKPKFVIL